MLLEAYGGPQAQIAAADDADVSLGRLFERRRKVWVLGQGLPQPMASPDDVLFRQLHHDAPLADRRRSTSLTQRLAPIGRIASLKS